MAKAGPSESWISVHIDGAARGNPGPGGLGVVFRGPDGALLATVCRYLGETTNNMAEYEALLAALTEAVRRGFHYLKIHTDSELLQRQVVGAYRVKSPNLLPLFRQVQGLLAQLEGYVILHVPREENSEADRLANQAIDQACGKSAQRA